MKQPGQIIDPDSGFGETTFAGVEHSSRLQVSGKADRAHLKCRACAEVRWSKE